MTRSAIELHLDRVGVVPPAVVSRLTGPYRLVTEWWPFVPPAIFVCLPAFAFWRYWWTTGGGVYYLNADWAIAGLRGNIPVPTSLAVRARDFHEAQARHKDASTDGESPHSVPGAFGQVLLKDGAPLPLDDFVKHLRAAIREHHMVDRFYARKGQDEHAASPTIVEPERFVEAVDADRARLSCLHPPTSA